MSGHREPLAVPARAFPGKHVRVLHDQDQYAAALARAAEGARRLHDRLAARAARDVWTAEHTEQRVGWLRVVRADTEGAPVVMPAAVTPDARRASSFPAA